MLVVSEHFTDDDIDLEKLTLGGQSSYEAGFKGSGGRVWRLSGKGWNVKGLCMYIFWRQVIPFQIWG